MPLFDEGVEAVKDVAPIASPDYSITEDASVSASLAMAATSATAPAAVSSAEPPQMHPNAQIDSTSYPAFHSAQSEYHSQSNVHHIEPFYR